MIRVVRTILLRRRIDRLWDLYEQAIAERRYFRRHALSRHGAPWLAEEADYWHERAFSLAEKIDGLSLRVRHLEGAR